MNLDILSKIESAHLDLVEAAADLTREIERLKQKLSGMTPDQYFRDKRESEIAALRQGMKDLKPSWVWSRYDDAETPN